MESKIEQISISDELKKLASELISSYLMEEPKDFIDYGYEFFKEKIIRRSARAKYSHEVVVDRERLSQRRNSVFSESFDPESDFKPIVYKKTTAQKKKLIRSAKKTLLFETLDEIDLVQVVNSMQSKPVQKGEYVIQQGATGDFFYVVEKGTFEAVYEEGDKRTVLNQYIDEGSFGELALLYNTPRACSVIAKTDGQLWALDRTTFRHIIVSNQHKKKKKHEHLIERVPVLSVLSEKQKQKLVEALVSRTYKNGARIIREGDVVDGMYFIESGRVRVTVRCLDTHTEEEVCVLKAGDYFGELGLVMKQPRAASVYALGLTHVAFLNTEAFERLLGPCVKLMKMQFPNYRLQVNNLRKSKGTMYL